MAIAKERYINRLICLKASTPTSVQPYTFCIMFTAFVVSQIDFITVPYCCAVSRGSAERCASCEATVVQAQVVHHVRPQ